MAAVTFRPKPRPSLLKRAGALLALLFVIVLIGSSCVTRVGAAQVGIRVKLAGSERGVESIPVVTGWVFYNRISEQIIVFPTSTHTTIWTRDATEGSPVDESITFSS
ncbi:MAG TPA: hypothetical protein VK459_25840, partial [Polyangiaceae bacterium]|nr:hypothetical protein [Polyangiaceae bacterium]